MKNPYAVSQQRLIYVFTIPDAAHNGLIKIGDTTISTTKKLPPNCNELKQAARKRIDEYTRTAGIKYDLLYTELAVDNKNNSFRDYDVHRLLKNFRHDFKITRGREWFKIDLDTAKQAIADVKRGKKFLTGIKPAREEIIFRPEQRAAINKTVAYFQTDNKFLWNAKMRFGKTLCALQVAKEMNFAKTIIITHRPVVNAGWYDDFNKIFSGTNYIYGGKGTPLEHLLDDGRKFVYFASMQDLRGSQAVNDNSTLDKNSAVFKTRWDFVIVDEAHEGTQTALGDAVIKSLVKKKTKFLALSGTPFNLLDDFDGVYTWDYVMEQRAKTNWAEKHFGDSNPYDELPRMNIFTYNLGKLFNYVDTVDISFSFREFFRTDGENFVHAADVQSFLNLLVKQDDNNYPFSRADFRKMFNHTLWIIPGVKEGRALSTMLKRHEVFKHFEIVNVAGNGDSDDEPADALKKVRDAIDNYDYTITLSCGKLTMGVTVPEWTAVFYLAGSYSTSAANYLQTIFRVQSPCNKGGVSKQNCYVFDFAPDRTLKMIADSIKVSTRAGRTKDSQRQALGELLNFCPVIAVEGSEMKALNTAKLLQRIKSAQAERAVRNGFEDNSIYNDTLRDLDNIDLKKFDALKKIIGTSKPTKKLGDIPVNEQGLTNEQREFVFPTTRRQLSPEQKENARKAAVKRSAISILRGISIRMPLLIYGAEVPINEDIPIEKFIAIVDDASWAEFMPAGVTKEIFADFIPYYDPEVFIKAGHIIRQRAKLADDLKPSDRVANIAELFATFKNPDKETVLTPWRVVKLHIDAAFDDNFFSPNKRILDINAKTGLYPLYVAYKIFRARLGFVNENSIPLDELRRLWDMTVAENIFVICKTPMAKTITRRTLLGFRSGNFNAHSFDDLINLLKNKPDKFLERLTNKFFWSKGVGKMFFDAVVGNPPYQNATANTSDEPVYNYFIDISQKLADKVSLIHPARCLFNAGKTPKDFNQRLLANEHFKVIKYFPNSQEIFPTSDIKGGVVVTYYDATKTFERIGIFIPFHELNSVHKKVVLNNKHFSPLSEIIYPPESFHFTKKFHEDNPNAAKILSDGHADDLTTNVFEKLPDIFLDDKPDDGREYIQVFGLIKMKRAYKWIRRDYIRNDTNLDKYKVIIPKSNGSGSLYEVLSTPLVGSPLVGTTQTFITVGAFATASEAAACLAYIKSKFCRAMLGILKVTQHNPPATWAKVPLQDFTPASDIDWTVSIAKIDRQLYAKYGLDAAEIEFIESHVKAME